MTKKSVSTKVYRGKVDTEGEVDTEGRWTLRGGGH